MSKKPEKPETSKAKAPAKDARLSQAFVRHKAAQAAIDAHFGRIDDEALAEPTFHSRK